MKRHWMVASVLICLLIIAGVANAQTAVEKIKTAGVLKVGATVTGVPATFLDKDSGKVVGIMVDVAQNIADHLGVKLEVVETQWGALIPSIETKKIDLICAAMYITDKRKEVIDFSEPVYPYCEALVVKAADSNEYKGIDDLKGLKIGAQVGTVYAKGLEERGVSDVKIYDNIGDVLMDITQGRIDAGIVDGPVAGYLVKTKTQFKVRMVKSYKPVMCGDIGVGVNKQDKDLLKEVNVVVNKLKQEKKIDQILTKWGQ